MGYTDNNLILEPSSGSAITATRYTANWLDLTSGITAGGTTYADLARGKNLFATFHVVTAAAATAGTLEFQIVNSPATTEAAMATTSAALTDAGDTVSWTAHGLPAGTMVVFGTITSTTGITAAVPYFVAKNGLAADTFKICTTLDEALKASGTVVALSTNGSAATVTAYPHVLASSGPLAPALLTVGTQVHLRLSKPAVHCVSTSKVLAVPTHRYLVGRFVETGTISTAVVKVSLSENENDGTKFYTGGFAIT